MLAQSLGEVAVGPGTRPLAHVEDGIDEGPEALGRAQVVGAERQVLGDPGGPNPQLWGLMPPRAPCSEPLSTGDVRGSGAALPGVEEEVVEAGLDQPFAPVPAPVGAVELPGQHQLILGAVGDAAGPQRSRQLRAVPWRGRAGTGEHRQPHAGTAGSGQPYQEGSLGLTRRPCPGSLRQLLQPPLIEPPGELRDGPWVIPQRPQPPAQSFVREGPRRRGARLPVPHRGVPGAGGGLRAGAVPLAGCLSPLVVLGVLPGAVVSRQGLRGRAPWLHRGAARRPWGQEVAGAPVGPQRPVCPQGLGVLPRRATLLHPGIGAASGTEGAPRIRRGVLGVAVVPRDQQDRGAGAGGAPSIQWGTLGVATVPRDQQDRGAGARGAAGSWG